MPRYSGTAIILWVEPSKQSTSTIASLLRCAAFIHCQDICPPLVWAPECCLVVLQIALVHKMMLPIPFLLRRPLFRYRQTLCPRTRTRLTSMCFPSFARVDTHLKTLVSPGIPAPLASLGCHLRWLPLLTYQCLCLEYCCQFIMLWLMFQFVPWTSATIPFAILEPLCTIFVYVPVVVLSQPSISLYW